MVSMVTASQLHILVYVVADEVFFKILFISMWFYNVIQVIPQLGAIYQHWLRPECGTCSMDEQSGIAEIILQYPLMIIILENDGAGFQ